jgi:ubiquinone/menaquinone biosynthesis C-methylase UbiE
VTFSGAAGAYDRYMGRYSRPLAPLLADFAGVQPGQRVLDVGCGPGALTAELVARVGARQVAAADPADGFARACAERLPSAEVQTAPAERLPWASGTFDAVLSQLVVSFMTDADAGVQEMRRVARPGGVVAACTWDYRGEMQMLRTFWDAALSLDPSVPAEGRVLNYIDADSLRHLWRRIGLSDVETTELLVAVGYDDYEDFWQPFLTGTGPAGAYCVSLDDLDRSALREAVFHRLGAPSDAFTLTARAWAVRGTV